jgi:HK97 family phage portal protein
MARLTTKIRYGLADLFRKSANIAFISDWVKTSFLDPTFHRLVEDGYKKNAAVYACVSTLAIGYKEPPPVVKSRNGDPQPNHPLQKLLNRPNPLMSHSELMQMVITYKAIGGQAYLHKVRGGGFAGQVVELWPYHAGQVTPIPSRFGWIEQYEFDDGAGNKTYAPIEDVIHLKWPSVDLAQPWMAMPPLRAIAQEVDSDNEMVRYQYALLKNDAMPRTVLNVKTSLTDLQFERLRQQFSLRHGGDNRGGVGIVEGEASIARLSMNLQELAFESLHRVPESRIAAAFKVPAIAAGLYVGMEKSTYNNTEQAFAELTQRTLVPMWKEDATELTFALAEEFPGDMVIEYDMSHVASLQEDQNETVTRAVTAFEKNTVVLDEVRSMMGLPPIDQLLPGDERGLFFSYELKAPAPAAPQPQIIDALVEPRQLTDDQKRQQTKARPRREDTTADVLKRMERSVEAVLKADYEGAVP